MSIMITELYRAFKQAGVDDGIAEEAASSVMSMEHLERLATKQDLSLLSSDVALLKSDVAVLKSDVAVLKSDVAVLKSDVAGLKSDMASVKSDLALLRSDVAADLAELKSDLTRWTAGLLLAQTVLFTGVVKLLLP